MNLIDMLKDQIGSTVMNKAAEYLGESSTNTQSAMGSILPAVLGGVINHASTTDGAKGLMGLLSNDNTHSGLLGNLGNMLGDSNGFSNIVSMGAPILKMLFGNKMDSITIWRKAKLCFRTNEYGSTSFDGLIVKESFN